MASTGHDQCPGSIPTIRIIIRFNVVLYLRADVHKEPL